MKTIIGLVISTKHSSVLRSLSNDEQVNRVEQVEKVLTRDFNDFNKKELSNCSRF